MRATGQGRTESPPPPQPGGSSKASCAHRESWQLRGLLPKHICLPLLRSRIHLPIYTQRHQEGSAGLHVQSKKILRLQDAQVWSSTRWQYGSHMPGSLALLGQNSGCLLCLSLSGQGRAQRTQAGEAGSYLACMKLGPTPTKTLHLVPINPRTENSRESREEGFSLLCEPGTVSSATPPTETHGRQ